MLFITYFNIEIGKKCREVSIIIPLYLKDGKSNIYMGELSI